MQQVRTVLVATVRASAALILAAAKGGMMTALSFDALALRKGRTSPLMPARRRL